MTTPGNSFSSAMNSSSTPTASPRRNPAGELFGTQRLDDELENCSLQAKALLESVLQAVERFGEGRPPDDDRTIIIARVG